MIEIISCSNEAPYQRFKAEYNYAKNLNQKMIQAACVSSYSKKTEEVNSRFVNLKFLKEKDFIFFSNYESIKSKEFMENNKISVVFYWNKADMQIRIKGKISRTSRKYNLEYFASRDTNKNALAISSNQSKQINSFDEVLKKFELVKLEENLKKCPEFWGGFKIRPYYFEFWKGGDSRLNKRDAYKLNKSTWSQSILQP